MKLKDVWKKKEVTLSFEAFPPKKDSDFASVASAVEKIAQLKPDFMSVTYGAGGGTSAYTGKIAQIVQAQGVTALAHLTCVSSDRDRIHHELDALRQAGIENILALRGDYPEGYDPSAPRDYRYARDLVEEIRAYGGFSIGGACYPEGHVECPSQKEDLRHLKEKVDCGVDFLVTQWGLEPGGAGPGFGPAPGPQADRADPHGRGNAGAGEIHHRPGGHQ